jgi:hypothetical protein
LAYGNGRDDLKGLLHQLGGIDLHIGCGDYMLIVVFSVD